MTTQPKIEALPQGFPRVLASRYHAHRVKLAIVPAMLAVASELSGDLARFAPHIRAIAKKHVGRIERRAKKKTVKARAIRRAITESGAPAELLRYVQSRDSAARVARWSRDMEAAKAKISGGRTASTTNAELAAGVIPAANASNPATDERPAIRHCQGVSGFETGDAQSSRANVPHGTEEHAAHAGTGRETS